MVWVVPEPRDCATCPVAKSPDLACVSLLLKGLILQHFPQTPTTPAAACVFHSTVETKSPNMSWRNQGITGSNNIPLGKARRFGSEAPDDERSAVSSPSAFSNGDRDRDRDRVPDRDRDRDRDVKRGRSPESTTAFSHGIFSLLTNLTGADDGPKRRKKRNRWGDATENKAAGLMGLPTAIVANMTSEQLEAYTLHLRIEEITQKLKIDDVVPADGDRYVTLPPFTGWAF
jgi:splicing factor 1